MRVTVLVCGNLFDSASEELSGPAEVLVERDRIAIIARSIHRGARPVHCPRNSAECRAQETRYLSLMHEQDRIRQIHLDPTYLTPHRTHFFRYETYE